MTRVLRLTPRYLHDADRLGAVTGSARGAAVVQTIRALLREDLLPGTGDVRALLPPTREAFVRRVPHRNLWLWYRMPVSSRRRPAPARGCTAPARGCLAPASQTLRRRRDGLHRRSDAVPRPSGAIARPCDGIAPHRDGIARRRAGIARRGELRARRWSAIAPRSDGIARPRGPAAPCFDRIAQPRGYEGRQHGEEARFLRDRRRLVVDRDGVRRLLDVEVEDEVLVGGDVEPRVRGLGTGPPSCIRDEPSSAGSSARPPTASARRASPPRPGRTLRLRGRRGARRAACRSTG